MKERAGDLELINPGGRIPLIFQCTLGSRELPKWGLKIPCAIGRFRFHTCLEPRLPQELRQLYYSELKNPESCFFWSLKVGGKGQKSIISVWNWVCLGNTEDSEPSTVPKGSSNEGTSAGSHWALHPLPAPRGGLSFAPIWMCCSVGSAPTSGPCWRQFQGQLRDIGGHSWSLHSPVRFTALLTPGTKNWCSGSHKHTPLFPLSGNHPALHPRINSQELKALLHCKMNHNSTDVPSVSPAS